MRGDDLKESEAGFTLMELLTVLAILALVIVISLPLLKTSGSGRTFRAQAQQISALLRLARIDAVTGSKETRVIVDLKGRRIDYPARAVFNRNCPTIVYRPLSQRLAIWTQRACRYVSRDESRVSHRHRDAVLDELDTQ